MTDGGTNEGDDSPEQSIEERILATLGSIDEKLAGVPQRLSTRNRMWFAFLTTVLLLMAVVGVRAEMGGNDARSESRCAIRAAFVRDHANQIAKLRELLPASSVELDQLEESYAVSDRALAQLLPADC